MGRRSTLTDALLLRIAEALLGCRVPDAMLELIRTAQKAGHCADFVLFDSWFSNPAQLVAIKNYRFRGERAMCTEF